ncbi:ParM/StbA family protein [Paenibacillus sp. ACRRX]|uniref:ParM/StbA family protein n=1 Tax=unclassified Paenibacillus TaxID=185978 RepID=UPI001EF49EAB|nr:MULTISPECIES: ParM/StbA family protein [unclassified Paenibacillus]MCG7408247.1 ParM/StbA family protein [Paenibacillus sp. ACRRX]MDK8181368.1 ParM/StbA family protein [Paenibacillus sp. UMB4589-SE434]
MNFHFFVGNDNGNSEHDLIIDGRLIAQPNVNCAVDELPWSEEQQPESFVKQLQEQLVVTIDSPAARPGMYYVGQFALESGELLDNLQIGIDLKSDMDLPVINTLAQIAAVAVQKAYEESKHIPEQIEVEVDMATALPVTQHTDETSAKFEKRFTSSPHHVTVHLGTRRIAVKITFPFVKAVPEATPVIFTLQKDEDGKWRDGDIFQEFAASYGMDKKFNGSYFKDKRILHVDIGDGSTEYPITEGNKFLRQFVHGSHHGAGYAIEEALDDFNRLIHLPNSPRQFFSDVLKNPHHKYYARAIKTVKRPLESQVKQIVQHVKRQLTKSRNEVDLICVYGGGSILMRSILYPHLHELCSERELLLLYIPDAYAVQMNAMGLNAFVRGKIYEALKSKAVQPV